MVFWSFYGVEKGCIEKEWVKFRGLFRNLSNILDGVFCKNSERLSPINYFCRKLHIKCLAGTYLSRLMSSKICYTLLHVIFTYSINDSFFALMNCKFHSLHQRNIFSKLIVILSLHSASILIIWKKTKKLKLSLLMT